MSTLLGVLQVTGKGGNELYVFDDAVVRAATGLAAALFGALDGSSGVKGVRRAVSDDEPEELTPEQLADQSKANVLVWSRNVRSATLAKGRWPTTGLRTLTLTAVNGETLQFGWPGDGATRPLNHDAYATDLLTRAFLDRLDIRL